LRFNDECAELEERQQQLQIAKQRNLELRDQCPDGGTAAAKSPSKSEELQQSNSVLGITKQQVQQQVEETHSRSIPNCLRQGEELDQSELNSFEVSNKYKSEF